MPENAVIKPPLLHHAMGHDPPSRPNPAIVDTYEAAESFINQIVPGSSRTTFEHRHETPGWNQRLRFPPTGAIANAPSEYGPCDRLCRWPAETLPLSRLLCASLTSAGNRAKRIPTDPIGDGVPLWLGFPVYDQRRRQERLARSRSATAGSPRGPSPQRSSSPAELHVDPAAIGC